jgi:Flp pilus assembly protein TadD
MARARRIAAQEPDSPVGYRLQGDVYMHMRRFDSAVRAYDSALKKGDSANLAIRLYEARRAAGKGALDFAERWAEKHAGDGAAQRLLASAYLHAGRNDEAMEIYQRLLKTAPRDTTSLNNIALLYQAKDDPRALVYAKRAYDAEPTHPATIDTYGWILVQRGDAEGGLKFLRNAKLRAPFVPEIRYHLAVALNVLGKPDEAKQELEAALSFGHLFEGIAEARALLAALTGPRR